MSRRCIRSELRKPESRRGAVLAAALACLFVTLLLGVALASSALHRHRQLKLQERQFQADWIANSATALAAARLRADPEYAGEIWTPSAEALKTNDAGRAVITVTDAENQGRRVTIDVIYPDDSVHRTRIEKSFVIGP